MGQSEQHLNDTQRYILHVLREVVRVLDELNISYYMQGGTMLGAIRHGGFIPWDDDVDLLMTRENFEKFRVVYPQECDQRFELTYLDTWTPRVMNRDPEKAAAFTDFFILDPVPEAGLKRKLWFLRLHMLQGMMKKKVDYSRFSWKNKILLFGTHIMGLPFSTEWKAKMYDKWSTSVKEGNDLCMSNGAFELMMHIWHPEQFEKKEKVPFESLECLIPAKWDEVLTNLIVSWLLPINCRKKPVNVWKSWCRLTMDLK